MDELEIYTSLEDAKVEIQRRLVPTPIMFYLYVLKSKVDNNLYIGSTKDLQERSKLHNAGKAPSTKL